MGTYLYSRSIKKCMRMRNTKFKRGFLGKETAGAGRRRAGKKDIRSRRITQRISNVSALFI